MITFGVLKKGYAMIGSEDEQQRRKMLIPVAQIFGMNIISKSITWLSDVYEHLDDKTLIYPIETLIYPIQSESKGEIKNIGELKQAFTFSSSKEQSIKNKRLDISLTYWELAVVVMNSVPKADRAEFIALAELACHDWDVYEQLMNHFEALKEDYLSEITPLESNFTPKNLLK